MENYKEFTVKILSVKGKEITIEPVETPDGKIVTDIMGYAFSNIKVGDEVTTYWIGGTLAIKIDR